MDDEVASAILNSLIADVGFTIDTKKNQIILNFGVAGTRHSAFNIISNFYATVVTDLRIYQAIERGLQATADKDVSQLDIISRAPPPWQKLNKKSNDLLLRITPEAVRTTWIAKFGR